MTTDAVEILRRRYNNAWYLGADFYEIAGFFHHYKLDMDEYPWKHKKRRIRKKKFKLWQSKR